MSFSKLITMVTLATAVSFGANMGYACSIEEPTNAQKRKENRQARASSEPVVVGQSCELSNVGIRDQVETGPAFALDGSRFYQVIDHGEGQVTDVIVGDCASREVIRIFSFEEWSIEKLDSACNLVGREPVSLLEPNGPFTLTEGSTLTELKSHLSAYSDQVTIDEDLEPLLLDDLGKKVPKKDRFDPLCGCKLHYPDSPGAKL